MQSADPFPGASRPLSQPRFYVALPFPARYNGLPIAGGAYIRRLRGDRSLVVGGLGRVRFPEGVYAYVGSALGPGGRAGSEREVTIIIDVHYHLVKELPPEAGPQVARDAIRALRIMGRTVDRAATEKRTVEMCSDPTGEGVLARMDAAGIDFTVVCAVDGAAGGPANTAMDQNRFVAEVALKHPGRIAALAGVDPRRPEGPDMLEECLARLGMIGLKYHPDSGYDPSGSDSYRLLEVLQRHGGILLSHTGPLSPPARCKYADVARLADLAVDFPQLTVIAAHMGQANWRPWAALASHQPSLHGDLAMWDPLAFGHYELFCRELRDLLDFAGASKVLFATDNPILDIYEPSRNWVHLIRDLPYKAPAGIRFTEEEVAGILGGNAARVLGLGRHGRRHPSRTAAP